MHGGSVTGAGRAAPRTVCVHARAQHAQHGTSAAPEGAQRVAAVLHEARERVDDGHEPRQRVLAAVRREHRPPCARVAHAAVSEPQCCLSASQCTLE